MLNTVHCAPHRYYSCINCTTLEVQILALTGTRLAQAPETMKSYQFAALSEAISFAERQSLLAQSNAVLTTPNCS